MTHDLISDMITRLRNANLVRHQMVVVPYTKINVNILKVLKKDGYIKDFFSEDSKKICVTLKYKGWWIKKPLFLNLKRISKPGQRIFAGYANFSKYCQFLKYKQGIAIISTAGGVMSHHKAKKLKRGGEILCYIS